MLPPAPLVNRLGPEIDEKDDSLTKTSKTNPNRTHFYRTISASQNLAYCYKVVVTGSTTVYIYSSATVALL